MTPSSVRNVLTISFLMPRVLSIGSGPVVERGVNAVDEVRAEFTRHHVTTDDPEGTSSTSPDKT